MTGQKWRRNEGFAGEFLAAAPEELVIVQRAVASQAIHAVQFEFVVKRRSSHEAFEPRNAHVLDVLEHHVILHHFDRGLDFLVGEPQPSHDLLCHASAHRLVSTEANSSHCIALPRRRLAQIVEEHCENERHRDVLRKEGEHEARMDKDVALRMKVRRLLAALERRDLGQDFGHEPARVEQVEAAHSMRRGKDLHELIADAFGADFADGRCARTNRIPGRGFNFESERGSKAYTAQQAKFVFCKAIGGISNGAQGARLQILAPPHKVEHSFFNRIVK